MGTTICLNMIVRNEAHVIRRCLGSVRPFHRFGGYLLEPILAEAVRFELTVGVSPRCISSALP
jgi:hypothetical protein